MECKKTKCFAFKSFWQYCLCTSTRPSSVQLDEKSAKHIFIGYDSSFKGYKLYSPKSGRTVIIRDVKFDEEDAWNWNVEEENNDFLPLLGEEENV